MIHLHRITPTALGNGYINSGRTACQLVYFEHHLKMSFFDKQFIANYLLVAKSLSGIDLGIKLLDIKNQ